MSVGRDIGDAITRSHTERLQRRRPSIASIEKFFIGQPQVTIHYGLAFWIKLTGTARKLQRGQRHLHRRSPFYMALFPGCAERRLASPGACGAPFITV